MSNLSVEILSCCEPSKPSKSEYLNLINTDEPDNLIWLRKNNLKLGSCSYVHLFPSLIFFFRLHTVQRLLWCQGEWELEVLLAVNIMISVQENEISIYSRKFCSL